MTLEVTWGPRVNNISGAGVLQDLMPLIDFLVDSEDVDNVNFSPTAFGATGTYGGQRITVIVEGNGFTESNDGGLEGTGTATGLKFMTGFTGFNTLTVDPSQVFLSIEGEINMGDLVRAIDRDDSGQDPAAIENFFANQAWIYNGLGGVDFVNGETLSQDDVEIRFNLADRFTLGAGDDRLLSGAGNDTVSGGTGNDTLLGQDGNDFLRGGKQEDLIRGGNGNDSIVGQSNADDLYGEFGRDTVKGGGGNDTIFGGEGNDFLKGGTREDQIFGDQGNDLMFGNSFDDTLDGGEGNDRLNAGGGDDVLWGREDNDTLKGGAGADEFVYSGNDGDDVILDFEVGIDTMLIIFDAPLDNFSQTIAATRQQGNDAVIDLGGGDSVTLRGVNRDDLSGSDFEF